MFKNVAGNVAVFAFLTTTGEPKAGDAANLTCYVSKDHGAVTVLGDTSATELEANNAKGWYIFAVTQAETNADTLLFTGKSSTANVSIVGQYIQTVPNRFGNAAIDANGVMNANAVLLAGQTITAAAGVTFPASVANESTLTLVKTKTDFLPSITAGNAGGLFLSGTNANTTVNFTGNLVGSVASVTGNVAGNVTGNVGGSVTGNLGGNVAGSIGSVATGGIVAGSFASGAITAGVIATDAIGAAEIAADAVAEIADAVWDELLAGHAISGSAGEALAASGAAGDPWTSNIPASYAAGTAGFIIGTNLNATISSRASGANLATANTAIADVATAVAAVKIYPDRTVVRGTVSATSPSTTSFTASALSPAGVAADQFKGRILIFDNDTTTTALRGQATDITASSAAGLPLLTYTALTNAPTSGDTFSIV